LSKRLLECPRNESTNCQEVQDPPSKSGRQKIHTKDLQILGAKAQDLVARATWRLGFVHPSSRFPVIGLAVLNYDADCERSVVAITVQRAVESVKIGVGAYWLCEGSDV